MGLIKIDISILKQTPWPPVRIFDQNNCPLDNITISLLQISKMFQIRSMLQKSGAYWGHCSQYLCPGLLTTPILASGLVCCLKSFSEKNRAKTELIWLNISICSVNRANSVKTELVGDTALGSPLGWSPRPGGHNWCRGQCPPGHDGCHPAPAGEMLFRTSADPT